jgi:hypothetical protein
MVIFGLLFRCNKNLFLCLMKYVSSTFSKIQRPEASPGHLRGGRRCSRVCCALGRQRQSPHTSGQLRSRRWGQQGKRRVREADGSAGGDADRAGGWWLYDGRFVCGARTGVSVSSSRALGKKALEKCKLICLQLDGPIMI